MFLYSVVLISNIGLITVETLTDEPNEKKPTFKKEPSSDNDEVTALDLIPPPNGTGDFNETGGYIFDDEKESVLVGKRS